MTTFTDLLKTRNPNESDLTLAYDYTTILMNIENVNCSTIRSSVLTVACLIAQNYNKSENDNLIIPVAIHKFKSHSIRLGVAVALCDDIHMLSAISLLIAFKSSSVQIVEDIVNIYNRHIDEVIPLVRRHSNCDIEITLEATQVYMTVMTDLEAMMMGLGFYGSFTYNYYDYINYDSYADRGWIYGPDGRKSTNEMMAEMYEKSRNNYKGNKSLINCKDRKKYKNITNAIMDTTTSLANTTAAIAQINKSKNLINIDDDDDDDDNNDTSINITNNKTNSNGTYEHTTISNNGKNNQLKNNSTFDVNTKKDDDYNDDSDDIDTDHDDDIYSNTTDSNTFNNTYYDCTSYTDDDIIIKTDRTHLLQNTCPKIKSFRKYIKTTLTKFNERIKKQLKT